MAYVPINDPRSGKLLFRYDPVRQLIEIVERGVKQLIDLTEYQYENAKVNAVDTGSLVGNAPQPPKS